MPDDKTNLSDQEIIKLILKGQTEQFAEIVQRYQQRLYYFLYRFTQNSQDSQDLTQETFIRAFFKLKTFKIEKKFSTWLYTIAHHQAINFYKQKKVDLALEKLKEKGEEPAIDWQPDLANKELQSLIQRAINQLPPLYREAISLYYLEELTYQEISAVTQAPLNTVRTRLHRAKALLEKTLKELI